ncbi:MAG: PepSY domain-containing protein [Nannocystaceae bacterium]|nr:PepSY domain-containing protein [bacterium]
MTFAEALSIAQQKVPDGVPVEVEIMRTGGRDVLEVELLVDGVIREVYLDPATGDVIAIQDEDGSEVAQQDLASRGKTLVEAAKVSLVEAGDIAREHVHGEETIEVEYLVQDGTLKLDVLVRTSDGYRTVHVDPNDGSVLSVDVGGSPEHHEEEAHGHDDDDHDDDDHDDDDHDDDDHDDDDHDDD